MNLHLSADPCVKTDQLGGTRDRGADLASRLLGVRASDREAQGRDEQEFLAFPHAKASQYG